MIGAGSVNRESAHLPKHIGTQSLSKCSVRGKYVQVSSQCLGNSSGVDRLVSLVDVSLYVCCTFTL